LILIRNLLSTDPSPSNGNSLLVCSALGTAPTGKWTEARGGPPARVKETGRGKDDPGIIRIDFPGYSGEGSLNKISWEEFFKKFDESKLAFVYQEKTEDGKLSNFNKLISRDSAKAKA
jgi:hypothetical protein